MPFLAQQGGAHHSSTVSLRPEFKEKNNFSIKRLANTLQNEANLLEKDFNELKYKTKVYEFYNAPITKFWAYAIAYTIFLCCFTYVVLVRLPARPEPPEWYVLAYMTTLLAEKVREILACESKKLVQKIEIWAEKLWNVFDVILIVFFLVGFVLRMQSDAYVSNIGRVIYCVDIVYWYVPRI